MSANCERRSLKSPGGECHDLFGAEFIGSPCHHRVLKPPGGGTSDIFGGSEPAQKPVVRKKSVQTSSIVLDDNVAPAPVENGHSKQGTCNERLFGPPLESNTTNAVAKTNGVAKANGIAKTNGEVLTNGNDHTDAAPPKTNSAPKTNGEAHLNGKSGAEPKPAANAAPRPRVPPGGFSSGLW